MKRYLIVAFAVIAALSSSRLVLADKDEKKVEPQAKKIEPPRREPRVPSAAAKAFSEMTRSTEKAIHAAKAYEMKAESKWKITGGKADTTGTTTLSVLSEGGKRFLIEVGTPDDADAKFLVVSDGSAITRVFHAAKMYSVTPSSNPAHDVALDGLTANSLRATGCDFLLYDHLHAAVMSQVARVADHGEKEVGGRKLHCFELHLANGLEVEVRFTTGAGPLPVELLTTATIPLDEKRHLTTTLNTSIDWNLAATPPAGAFALKIPEGVKKVDDLTEEVLGLTIKDILGKPAPEAKFDDLDGKRVSLKDYKDKSVVAVVFWASWSVPEASELPGVQKFIDEYRDKGVAFFAVNVGDTVRAVRAVTEKAGFKSKVLLDAGGEGMAAFRAHVPTVVLIGKDGTVQAVHRGRRADTREHVKKDLDALLMGDTLAPKP